MDKIKNPVKNKIFNRKFLAFEIGYLTPFSSETVNLYLPRALLLANTRLPFLVDILDLKPCLFTLFLLEG